MTTQSPPCTPKTSIPLHLPALLLHQDALVLRVQLGHVAGCAAGNTRQRSRGVLGHPQSEMTPSCFVGPFQSHPNIPLLLPEVQLAHG